MITTPTRLEAADQRLTAAVRDAATLIRCGADPTVATAIMTAGQRAERILGPTRRHYTQTFRVGRP